jgi:hypothetical protein
VLGVSSIALGKEETIDEKAAVIGRERIAILPQHKCASADDDGRAGSAVKPGFGRYRMLLSCCIVPMQHHYSCSGR